MSVAKFQIGLIELVGLAGLIVVAALVALGVRNGWPVAIVPGVTYIIASGAVYVLYRQHQREGAVTSQTVPGAAQKASRPAARLLKEGSLAQATGTVAFRVVGSRGACTLGRHVGDLVSVDPQGTIAPQLCPYAETTLRQAATEAAKGEVKEWCCPVYDHLLVFRHELQAA